MAIDEALLLRVAQDSRPPVLRFYSWKPPTVSIGYHQKVADRFDLTECRRRGIDLVRRPTGGREVLHLGDLTYAFSVSRASLGQIEPGFRSSTELLGKVFEHLLRLLGIPPERISLGRAPRGSADIGRLKCQPCFASLSQYEVSVDGKKLIGSAQKSQPEAFLQHGSILLSSQGMEVVELLKDDGGSRSARRRLFRDNSTSLGEVLSRKIGGQEVIAALKETFSCLFNFEVTDSVLEPQELRLGLELQRSKYQSSDWYYPANENSYAKKQLCTV